MSETVPDDPHGAEAAAGASAETELRCQIARSLDVIGEKWSLLIVREAFRGRTRFTEFRTALGAPSDILTQRLGKLVDAGVLEKHAYREAGSRERSSYHLTDKGRGLSLVLGALAQWGDEYAPYSGGQASVVVDAADGSALSLQFVDPNGRPVAENQVTFHPGPAARERW
ncbi:winged helix-turn-helix transcriptional regulator [Herbiconiux sp. YIM B11900]|uniref:winged helix-turn-helix transcriptional regulator n=1 Tax=Herbiconiux sp. YIM B11900 TaxID=3404131 RepID=UPI003F846FD4